MTRLKLTALAVVLVSVFNTVRAETGYTTSGLGSYQSIFTQVPDVSGVDNSVAGLWGYVGGSNATAYGSGGSAGPNDTVLGAGANALGPGVTDSVAIGAFSSATEAKVVSFGSPGNTRRLVQISAGINGTDAVNLSQMQAAITAAGAGGVTTQTVQSMINTAVQGVMPNIAAVGQAASAAQATANQANAAAGAGGVTTQTVQNMINTAVQGVTPDIAAAGQAATLAGQAATAAKVAADQGIRAAATAQATADGIKKDVATAQSTADLGVQKADKAQSGVDTAIQQLIDTNQRIDALDHKVDRVARMAASGTAIALAMAQPLAVAPGETAVGVGVGGYQGAGALGLTLAHSIKRVQQPGEDEPTFSEVIVSAGLGAAQAGGAGVRFGLQLKF